MDGDNMPETQTWTIKRLLDWTTEYFETHGADSPRLEAEILLAEALDCQRIQLYTRFNEVPAEPGLGIFRAWVKRRAAGEPVAYLVGHREFYSLKFFVDQNVLIPRPETEHLVVEAIEAAQAIGVAGTIEIADVGTGSGCIAVAVAKHITNARVTACDLSSEALAVAKRNVDLHQMGDRINLVQSDLLDGIPELQFDIILSNPPYVGEDEVDTLDESVRQYEPAIALFSGGQGTDMIQRLLDDAQLRLKPGGMLIFETSPIIMENCLERLKSAVGLERVKTVKDLAGHPRLVVARKLKG